MLTLGPAYVLPSLGVFTSPYDSAETFDIGQIKFKSDYCNKETHLLD